MRDTSSRMPRRLPSTAVLRSDAFFQAAATVFRLRDERCLIYMIQVGCIAFSDIAQLQFLPESSSEHRGCLRLSLPIDFLQEFQPVFLRHSLSLNPIEFARYMPMNSSTIL